MRNLLLVLATIRYLKPVQIWYQVKYRISKPKKLKYYLSSFKDPVISLLSFDQQLPVIRSFKGGTTFEFLNIKHTFDNIIDWNIQRYGKLWNYNLQYLNFILQRNVPLADRTFLIESFYNSLGNNKLALEPYPVSLRIMNIIRLCSTEGVTNQAILKYVGAELEFLSKRPEYHLLGNHLLENGFALMMGGAFFAKDKWLQQGEKILSKELTEQVLSDGGHFELSPMYHQIILFRVLELIDWYKSFNNSRGEFLTFLKKKAGLMCSWLAKMTFRNGDIPHFNDSSNGVSYSTEWLLSFAEKNDVEKLNVPLGVSGYRGINTNEYECRVDFAQIGSSYQPGHAHSDALAFVLNFKGMPLFTEVGTSTYQIGDRRTLERSTISHNTVVVEGRNQSNIWGGFRVAQRANVTITKDEADVITALHDGYKSLGIIHKRKYTFQERQILIFDELSGNDSLEKITYIHLAPGINCNIDGYNVSIENNIVVKFIGAKCISIDEYEMAVGYNRYEKGSKIIICFENKLTTDIVFK